jgi:hypothetical protein
LMHVPWPELDSSSPFRLREKADSKKRLMFGRSLSADRRSKVKKIVKKGEGDRGDQRR